MYIIKLSLPIDTPSFVVCDPASTLGAWLTSDPMEARTWGTPASAECWIEQHHLHATVEPQIPPVISLPCPLGCGRTAAAEGSCIHYCVRRERGLPTEREYVGTFDGAAMFYGDSYHDVQVQLDDYALGLLQDGLVDVVPNAVYARPGEVAPEVHYTDLPAGHRLADDDEPGWFYGQEDGNLAWITDAPTFVALPEPINVALCDACTQIATQQIGGRTWCDACAPTLPAAPQAHAPGAEEETAAPPADGGQSCHCGADVAYLVRESQRGHETIHRVCEECYRREFYENEENSWAWEILYCDYCANPTPAIDLLPPLALTSGFVPPQNPVCGTCRAQFLSAPATTPPTRGESAAMIAAETICVSTPARPARRATNLLFVRTGAAGWRCQAGHVFQTLASALPIACPTCDGAPVSPCTVCGGPHRPTQCPKVTQEWRRQEADVPLPCIVCGGEHPPSRYAPPDAGAAIARQWHRDRARFLIVLQALDRAAWRVLAEAYAAWLSRTGTWQTPEHVLAAWEKAVDGRIDLPARVRS